ncbi:MAG: MFS transporter [Micrococcus sp.]|nr:MFS transporter [Micrococcus sp.]
MTQRGRAATIMAAAGLLLVALNLRAGVASVGPVMTYIREDLGISAAASSLLTAIPVFAFGLFAFLTPTLTRRIGRHRLIGVALAVLTLGILLRLLPAVAALFAGTLLVGAAIAVGNVTVPAIVKQDFAHRSGVMMGLYSMALTLSATLAFGLTAPAAAALGGQWRLGLGMWALLAIAALAAWVPQLRRRPAATSSGSAVDEATLRRLARHPVTVAVSLYMGVQSLGFYSTLTWAPSMLQSAGMDSTTAGLLLAYATLPSMVTSMVVPLLAGRSGTADRWVRVGVAALVVAYLGLWRAPVEGAWLWMTLLGLAQGMSLALGLSFIVWRSATAHITGQLSTLAQGVGYMIAGLGPLILGSLFSLTGAWSVPLGLLLLMLIPQAVFGVLAARPRTVGERR